MKKALYKIFLGDIKLKRGLPIIPLWFVYLLLWFLLQEKFVYIALAFAGLSALGIIRLGLTIIYGTYAILIAFLPIATYAKLMNSNFHAWVERNYNNMYKEPK